MVVLLVAVWTDPGRIQRSTEKPCDATLNCVIIGTGTSSVNAELLPARQKILLPIRVRPFLRCVVVTPTLDSAEWVRLARLSMCYRHHELLAICTGKFETPVPVTTWSCALSITIDIDAMSELRARIVCV